MPIKSIMKTNLVVAGPDESVLAATKRMSEKNLGAVLVVDHERLTGIFTERDLLNRVIAAGKDPATTKVRDVATGNPRTVLVTSSLHDCFQLIKSHDFRHLPVLDEHGRPAGIISARDFLRRTVLRLESDTDMALLFEKLATVSMSVYVE